VSVVLHCIYYGTVDANPIYGTVGTVLALLWVYLDKGLLRRRPTWQQKTVTRMAIYQAIMIYNVSSMAIQVVSLTAAQIRYVFITTIDILAVTLTAIFCLSYRHITLWPDHRTTRTVLLGCAELEIAIGNITISLKGYGNSYHFFQHVGAFIIGNAMLGLAICLAMREVDRLNFVLTRFIRLYHLVTAVCMALEVAYLGVAIKVARNPDIFLATAALAINVVHTYVASRIQTRPNSNLKIEVINLNELTDSECDGYADLIGRYGQSYAGAPSGKQAISLMKAYVAANNKNMSCIVLRVSKDSVKPSALPFGKNTLPSTYDEMVAWRDLDKEMLMPQTVIELDATTSNKSKSVSKSKLKRLQKKNKDLALAATAAKLQEAEFKEKLESTEALVLLTRIEHYDLTESVKGWFGRVLCRGLGIKSYYKPLVVPMGMLAFHWPFRQSTFYTHTTKRPIARSAAVSRAIQEWNKSAGKEKCILILDPRYENDSTERAIQPSGWNRVPLPASHIVDLRPYKGKSIGEYLKAIKYRNKSNFSGEIVESTDFTPIECEEVMELWKKIAEKRASEGHHAVLAQPTLATISAFKNEDNYRSLLFLKVDGKTIASCVLFRLGDTITSDLQGLDHEEARKHKAYFVMMQHTIEIALKEGISFVDFGPTTAKPKLDIGCTSVPLMGGITATNPLLNFSIKHTAQSISEKND
jgi:Acetyltransferase (GNAT) domain